MYQTLSDDFLAVEDFFAEEAFFVQEQEDLQLLSCSNAIFQKYSF